MSYTIMWEGGQEIHRRPHQKTPGMYPVAFPTFLLAHLPSSLSYHSLLVPSPSSSFLSACALPPLFPPFFLSPLIPLFTLSQKCALAQEIRLGSPDVSPLERVGLGMRLDMRLGVGGVREEGGERRENGEEEWRGKGGKGKGGKEG